jgi:hypothetical protein
MIRLSPRAAYPVVLVAAILVADSNGSELGKATDVVERLIASRSLSETQKLADMLSEYALDDAEVQRLIDAASSTTPEQRAQLVSVLRRQIPPVRYLRDKEPLEVKLAAVAALGQIVEDGWTGTGGYTYLRQAYRELLPLAQDEEEPELARAAARMIKTMEVRYGEKAGRH